MKHLGLFWLFIPLISAALPGPQVMSTIAPSTSQDEMQSLTSTSSASFITLNPQNFGMTSIPICMRITEMFYNAFFTDVSGNIVGGRIDYLQPNIWLLDGEKILDCLVIASFISSFTKNLAFTTLPLSVTYEGTSWDVDQCFSNGAIDPYTVFTTTVDSVSTTITSLLYRVEHTLTLLYGQVTYAAGPYVNGNLSINSTNGTPVNLTNFDFLIADWSNRVTGGFGLGNSKAGEGMINYLYRNQMIQGNGYSVYYANSDNATDGSGIVILGGVDSSYISGNFYTFPRVPHTLGNSLYFPIVVLQLVYIKNLNTGASQSLYSDAPFPVLFDSRLRYSYLPTSLIVTIAIQTNAVYSSDQSRWIVRCNDIWNTNAILQFNIGPLTINVPLQSMVSIAGSLLYSNGDQACYLRVLPVSYLGYAAFGLNILTHVYMAMDNEKGNIAIANANTDIRIKGDDVLMNATSIYPNATTYGVISSGYIPFATRVTLQPLVTLTFLKGNISLEASFPARFSGSLVLSDSFFISDNIQSLTTSSSSRSKSSSNGMKILDFGSVTSVLTGYLTLAIIGFVAVIFL